MNKWFLLLVVIGLAAAGWLNRDRISELMGHKTVEEAPAEVVAPPATPNPAAASVALAKKTYPALGIPNSSFNKRFVADYNELKVSNPNFLAQSDWPMQLAARAATELGGGAMPTGAEMPPLPPNHLAGSALNARPNHPGATATPSLLLPGLQGSSLDARPQSRGH